MCVCVCVRAHVYVCVHVCMRGPVSQTLLHYYRCANSTCIVPEIPGIHYLLLSAYESMIITGDKTNNFLSIHVTDNIT